jgi:hypothetical protein
MVFDMEKRMAPKKQAVQKRSVKMPMRPVKASSKAKPPGAKVAKSQAIEKAKTALKKESKSIAVKESVKAKAKEKAVTDPSAAEQKSAGQKPVAAKRPRKISIEISAHEAASALAAKWATLNKKAEQIDVKPYNMKGVFEERTAITHKVLGWGYILANRNDRLEVLFKDGIKYLLSNYKPA